MNKQEVQKVMAILLEADGGCLYCAAELVRLFCVSFPEHAVEARKSFLEKFGKEVDEIGEQGDSKKT